MSREGELYRVITEDVFVQGSIVRLVKDEGDNVHAFTLVLGDVLANIRATYERRGLLYNGPYIFDSLSNMEKI